MNCPGSENGMRAISSSSVAQCRSSNMVGMPGKLGCNFLRPHVSDPNRCLPVHHIDFFGGEDVPVRDCPPDNVSGLVKATGTIDEAIA